jgi:hypothetical protein
MSKKFQKLLQSFFSLGLVIFVIGSYVIGAQEAVTGTWKAEVKPEKNDKIYVSFDRKTEKGGKHQHGSSFAFSDFQSLSREKAQNGRVSFSLAREAGTIECEGEFTNGKGAGTFRFTPNKSFVDAMRSRGFDFEKSSKHAGDNEPENRLFAATTLKVTTALADDLLSANFGKLDVEDLFKAAIFKVDSKFMREMKDSGFPNLGMEELVKARIFQIDADFLRELNTAGFSNEPFESVVKMRIFKITPEFINGVRSEGFQNLEIEDMVKMKIFKIDAEFIRQARAEGVPMQVEKLVEKRIGVWKK